ncbi:MAG: DUF1501 domain-containing protein [Bacteroidetes bacterium]|jgi:uncharacterized protein (DUF1501 family)|nr:DUF1501 domain-containing protein [Bacteroidota bacterium]MBX7128560.1 DUF1501 domain-containing protein [Flavobacteriales bacterium]MCC6655634.1 DUF1501 domain-containing protein [Flavobacteriales bacterium]HMU14810.1 DUF1501 domain-containing protein [Flavobacteriales bacterium]HMW97832.1 DUF1501 domain-containing protein [Flavobacteriales bacterium]
MDRRRFLRATSIATIGGMSVRGFSSPLLRALGSRDLGDRVLVVVQLYGGNDGLNTVIPLDQYGILSSVRPHVIIPESAVLPLSGLDGTGLHPALGGLQSMWNDGKLSIVQGVSYPEPNYSHFRATDIWETGADHDQILNSGWTGRYLNLEYPNYPSGYPNAEMPDPLAIRIGGPVGPALQYLGLSMGTAIVNTDDPLDLSGNIYNDPLSALCSGNKLGLVRTVQEQTDLYGDVINAAAQMGCAHGPYPEGTTPGAKLGQALRIVAQLICGGLKTRIYWVSLTGFDTHAEQVQESDHTLGTHANLLQGLNNAIHAFQNDLAGLGLEDRVLGMTFSEFGRRIVSNASIGTDHGSAQPMFLFGSKVIPGMLGTNPEIPVDTSVQTNLAMQYDFRSVYASILTDWFCLQPEETDQVLLDTYQPLALVDPEGCINIGVHEQNQRAGDGLLSVYPSPFTDRITVNYVANGGRVLVQVYNESGKLMTTLLNAPMAPGNHTLSADLGELPAGVYYCRLQNESRQQVRNILKVR